MRAIVSAALSLVVLAPAFVLTVCGPDLQREAMITFTREALAIEAERDDSLKFLLNRYPSPLVPFFFLNGDSREGLPSAHQLRSRMLLLDSPPSLQAIKDSLLEAYRLEIEAAQFHGGYDLLPPKGTGKVTFHPRIDRFNIDSYKPGGENFTTFTDMTSPWVIAQELRRDAYAKWVQLLRSHGIDPVKEGFTSLVQQ